MAAGGNIIGQAMIEVIPLTTGFQQNLNAQLQRAQVGAAGGIQIPIAANTQHLQNSVRNAIPKTPFLVNISGNTKPLTDAVTMALSGFARKALTIAGIGSVFGMVISHLKDAVYGFNNVIQQAQIGLETILNSATQAADLIEQLKVFARTTPFNFASLVTQTQTLVAMGTAAEDVIPTLTAVGDALSGLGRMSQLPRVIYDLGQVRATGRITGRELMNLAMQGIPVLKYLADATGKSMEQIREQMALGVRSARGMMIDSETAISAILIGMEKQFGGLMVRQMGTAAGAISNWKDAEQQLLGAIGKPLFDEIIKSTVGLSAIISDMAKAFSTAGQEGKSGLTAVKEVFVNLFPAAARDTVASVLSNLSKGIHDLGIVIKTVVQQLREWGSVIAGILGGALRGLLNVLTPINNFLTHHKTLVQDLVKVYIALKVIEVVNSLWVKANVLMEAGIARTMAFTSATKTSTASIVQQTIAMRAQAAVQQGAGLIAPAATLNRMGGLNRRPGLSATGQTLPTSLGVSQQQMAAVLATTSMAGANFASPGNYGTTAAAAASATQKATAAAASAAVAAEGKFARFANAMKNSQIAGLGLAAGLEVVKMALDHNSSAAARAATALTTITQGALVGGALGAQFGPEGAAAGAVLGTLVGGLSAFSSALGTSKEEAKAFADAVSKDAAGALDTFKTALDNTFGTDATAIPGKIKVSADALNKMVDEEKARVNELNALNNAAGSGRFTKKGDRLQESPEYKQKVGELADLQLRIKGLQEAFSPTGELGTSVEHFRAILAGSGGEGGMIAGPESMSKMLGIRPEDAASWFKPAYDELGKHAPILKSTAELIAGIADGTVHFTAVTDALNNALILSAGDYEKMATTIAGAAAAYDVLLKAASDYMKQQTMLYQVDRDVADAHQAVQDTFQTLTDAVKGGKMTLDSWEKSAKSLRSTLDEVGKAANEAAREQGKTAEEAAGATVAAQYSVTQGFVDMMKQAGNSDETINQVLKDLGLLRQFKDWSVTLKVIADTDPAIKALKNFATVLHSLGLLSPGMETLAKAFDVGIGKLETDKINQLIGDAGGYNKDTIRTPTPAKEKSGQSAADKAAAALESASKSFYDTVVASAKAFTERVLEIMGNPAERIQFAQARSTSSLIRNTALRTAAITDWTEGIAKLKSEGLSKIAIDALGLMKGPEMDRQVKRLLKSTPDEIGKLNASLTSEAEAAQKAAYMEQGNTIAKAITDALAKFFADAGTTPGGPGSIQITNQITQAFIDPQALALALVAQLGGKVKL